MRGAALIVAGNEYLAQHAYAAGARKVAIVPSVIDLARYEVAARRSRARVVIGWIGSPSTFPFLARMAPTLKALSVTLDTEVRVIGANPPPNPPDFGPVSYRPWREDTEVEEIQDFDIGIMPLSPSPWEKGKCGYKLIQYMACGIPVVASPVGVNCKIVQEGLNGHLADTDEEWAIALRHLATDSSARLSMGQAGRLAVEAHYCVQIVAPELARLFRQVLAP